MQEQGPACYSPGDVNPVPSNEVDGQCQVCRPTGSGYLIPGTNAGWNREDWNLVEKNGNHCNDNNPRTHTDTCVNGACFGTYYDGTTATRELVVNGAASEVAVPGGPTATCDETMLNDVDQCQTYNGGGQNTDGSPRRWAAGTAPCQASGLAGTAGQYPGREGWEKEACSSMATPDLARAMGSVEAYAPCTTNVGYCFIDNQCFLHQTRKPYGNQDSYHDGCKWCDTSIDQFTWTDVPAGARCGGNKVGAQAAPFYVHHPAYAQEDDDSCTYNEVCDGAGSCTMDATNCVFAPSCGVNPAPNTCVADAGDNCKDFNADNICDDNTQTCAYAGKGTAANFACRAEVDGCNLASTCTDAKGVYCPETSAQPLITVTKTAIEHSPLAPWLDDGQQGTESAVEIVDHVEPTDGAPQGC
jgi:hypothetical protein